MLNKRICKELLNESFQGIKEFKVHSCFDHSINLIDRQDNLITILDQTKGMMPFSILFPSLPVIKEKDSVFLDHGTISINGKCIELQGFTSYDGSIDDFQGVLNWENLKRHFDELADFLKNQGNKDGILPLVIGSKLNERNKMIHEDYLNWQKSYENQIDFDILTKGMIGYGNGLTPSFDDMMCGLMISDIYFCKASGADISRMIERNRIMFPDWKDRTNLISCHMLKMAGNGICSEAVKKLLNLLYQEEINLKDDLTEVKNFGHSSGTDILCGIYLSIKNKIEYNKRML